jgi:hypothetical protein
MAWPPAPANASLVTKWLSPVKPDAKSPAKRPRHGEALPTRNLPQTPLSQQNEHNPLHILPMALAIKTRHRRNGSLTHGYTIQAATLHPYGSAVVLAAPLGPRGAVLFKGPGALRPLMHIHHATFVLRSRYSIAPSSPNKPYSFESGQKKERDHCLGQRSL